MGREQFGRTEPGDGPQIILMAGLQGVGKTTPAAKIAKHLHSRKRTENSVASIFYTYLDLRSCW